MFGHLVMPDKLRDICFSCIPLHLASGWRNKEVCLTGSFACAPGSKRRVDEMQLRLDCLGAKVTENWKQSIDLLVVGDRAKIVTFKIRKAIEKNIPIIKEYELLARLDLTTRL